MDKQRLTDLRTASRTITNTAQRQDYQQLLQDFASLITQMIPLAEKVLSKAYTAEERWEFRQPFPEDGDVFHLSNLLNGLCSETARRLLLAEDHQRQHLYKQLYCNNRRPFQHG